MPSIKKMKEPLKKLKCFGCSVHLAIDLKYVAVCVMRVAEQAQRQGNKYKTNCLYLSKSSCHVNYKNYQITNYPYGL